MTELRLRLQSCLIPTLGGVKMTEGSCIQRVRGGHSRKDGGVYTTSVGIGEQSLMHLINN